jgi:hypothetical protein
VTDPTALDGASEAPLRALAQLLLELATIGQEQRETPEAGRSGPASGQFLTTPRVEGGGNVQGNSPARPTQGPRPRLS